LLIYIEYISRRPGVGVEAFHKLAGRGQEGWAGDHPDDLMVANLGRTWRLGPEPEYLCVWWTPNAGLDRIDAWERVFRAGEADVFEEPFKLAARIDRAGCYEPLIEPVVGATERYYLEFLDFAEGVTRDEVRASFEQRQGRHGDLTLNLLADRIGRLGPDPRALALWGLPTWAALDGIARDLDDAEAPIRLVTAGCYSQMAKETL
jgi:hypothetical protein